MYFKVSWDDEFDQLMMHLWSKYGKEMFTVDGIGEQMDLHKFSKKFFNEASATADASVDANANVTQRTSIEYNFEMPKPLRRYNSYFCLWKQLRKDFGLELANKIIEAQLNGEIYVNDFTDVNMPYSYHPDTVVTVRKPCGDGYEVSDMTLKQLYEECSSERVCEDWTEKNDTHGYQVLLASNGYNREDDVWTPLTRCVKHVSHTDCVTVESVFGRSITVTTDHPFFMADGSVVKAGDLSIGDYVPYDVMYDDFITAFSDAVIENEDVVKMLIQDEAFYVGSVKNVVRVPYVGEEVYDITTECHRFSANGYLVHNCFNYSTNDIKYGGLVGLSDRPYVKPPKSLDVFIRQVEQFMVIAANGSLGASGFSDALIVASTYVDKIIETGQDGHINIGKNIEDIKTYVKEKLTEFIYTVNWPFRGGQSPFSNLSVYDKPFLEHLCPDYGANIETVQMLQELYLDAMNDEMARTPLTFPVTTACFCTDEDNNLKDKEFAKFIAEKNLKYGFINIYNGKTTNLSSCCFDGKQKVWIKRGEVPRQVTFETLKKMSEKQGYVEAYNGTEWAKAKLVELPARDMYVIFTENHNSLFCTDNHIHVLGNGEEKITTELNVGDSLKHVHLGKDKIVYVGKVEDYDKPTVFCLEMADGSKPYFELGNGIITHNCRLRSSTDNPYFNTFGAGSAKIGSLGVVTVSFPRAAMKAVDKADAALDPALKEQFFMENLRNLFDMECMINSAKRKLISKRIELGAAPLYTHGYMALSKQYSTFGIVGLNEAVEIMGYDILTKEGQQFVSRVLDTINEWVLQAENHYKAPHNVEQVPSEGSAVKLATKDKMMGYDCGVPFYSNQFIPLVTPANMLDRIRLQGMFDSKMSGGAICHINVAEEITDPDKMANLMEYAAKCGVIYWAVNYRIRMCEDHHTWVGTEKCPVCGKPYTDEITRVVGFFTNTKHWNKTRREHDWPNRQFYSSI